MAKKTQPQAPPGPARRRQTGWVGSKWKIWLPSVVVAAIAAGIYALARSHVAVRPSSLPRWGTFRPNVYFGVRARDPDSPLIGLMWYGADSPAQLENIRHDCAEGDKLSRYGWLEHDGRHYGLQELADPLARVNITTEFINLANASDAGSPESWMVRIRGAPLVDAERSRPNVSLLWYVTNPPDDPGRVSRVSARLDLRSEPLSEGRGIPGPATEVDGHASYAIGPFGVTMWSDAAENSHPEVPRDAVGRSLRKALAADKESKPARKGRIRLDETYFMGRRVPAANTWNVKPLVQEALVEQMRRILHAHVRNMRREEQERAEREEQENVPPEKRSAPKTDQQLLRMALHSRKSVPTLPNQIEPASNVLVFQQILTAPFTLELVLHEEKRVGKRSRGSQLRFRERARQSLQLASNAFHSRFEAIFGLEQRGYDWEHRRFASAALSNMLGGMGYFFGSSVIQSSPEAPPAVAAPRELLATVPSRSFFPRGFMWDEGFHQLLVSAWDLQLSLDVFRSWITHIDSYGWLPREQILGDEARARVPEQFRAQKPWIANPPTQLLAIRTLLQRMHRGTIHQASLLALVGDSAGTATSSDESRASKTSDPDTDDVRLKLVLYLTDFLVDVYADLQRQADWLYRTQASAVPDSFAWKERSLNHSLASGLDDYPRASWLTPEEGHVDLHSWVIMVCDLMADMAEWILQHGHLLERVHTPSLGRIAAEYRARSKRLKERLYELHWDPEQKCFADYAYARGATEEEHRPKFVQHQGYVSLFPMLLGLLPGNSDKLGSTMELLASEKKLWSSYGVLSLSQLDPAFGSGEDYWRGAIWMNMNYLVLRALHLYSHPPSKHFQGPYQERAQQLYAELRRNVVENVFSEYRRTGYLWEQYSARDGKGRRSHPFTGWTALVVLMMAEMF